MKKLLRIGTRDSQLAVWQATRVQHLLQQQSIASELVQIKSEGDIDTITPLYALGVQGIFTKTLDAALLNNRVDIVVHSMKDVPTQLAQGIEQAAVLKRASHKDIFVFKNNNDLHALGYENGTWNIVDPQLATQQLPITIGTSSIRRIAQWLHRYPNHQMENIRGNVNTRLRKLKESTWAGAIFAAAGLERINLRPENSIDLDWMLPAPSQGAIVVVCRQDDEQALEACAPLNDEDTALCTKLEKDFLRLLMGGCSTPISALAQVKNGTVHFKGQICSTDGTELIEVSEERKTSESSALGEDMANALLQNPNAQQIITDIRYARK